MMTQFEKDLDRHVQMNNGIIEVGTYNLIVSIRDLKLWKAGLKPHKHWKITDVKKYFGIKGNVDKCIETLEMYLVKIKQLKDESK